VMGDQKVKVGDTVEVGAVIATIEESAAAAKKPAVAKETPGGEKTVPSSPATSEAPAAEPEAAPTMSPAVRRAVLEHGIDPSTVKGTGKDGRLTKEDVLAAAKARDEGAPAPSPAPTPAAAPAPSPSPTPAGSGVSGGERREERVKMTRLRQTIAKRLKGAQEEAALLTTFNDCDMSAVIEARELYKEQFAKKYDIKLGFMSFFAKAAVLALQDVPAVNARIEGDEIVYHDFVDISIAVSAPNGLVVPVVRDCDKKSFAEIEQAIAEYGRKAKEGTLTIDEMHGGTFTISNGGVFGSLLSTPIVNPPQSAVLGLHRIEDRPVARNDQVVIKPMMYLALSYDHRLIDGREAVTALKIIKEAIEDPMRILIDL
jgi:2-oxoglutarate dehydrogenase E2 component (dihydrolipoamide succinyltransferase)